MSHRQHSFAPGEFYHCYNRGVDKRVVFEDSEDFSYFLKGLIFYNKEKTGTKLRESLEIEKLQSNTQKTNRLVNIHAYCLNKNHFHLLLEELVEGGISKYMQKILTSYVMYFNKKNERSGTLFQGRFKSTHVDTDIYLHHIGVYINLNNFVHGVEDNSKYRSSLREYEDQIGGICNKELLLRDVSASYKKYAFTVLPSILERKALIKDLKYSEFID